MSMALMTRQSMPLRSKQSWSESELMTVASMPMLSPCARSIPAAAPESPRKMFPPPTTMATWTPASQTGLISSASRCGTAGSMPKD